MGMRWVQEVFSDTNLESEWERRMALIYIIIAIIVHVTWNLSIGWFILSQIVRGNWPGRHIRTTTKQKWEQKKAIPKHAE